jgi:hypothetical protein
MSSSESSLLEQLRRSHEESRRASVERESFSRFFANLDDRSASLRARAAEFANRLAEEAEAFAACSENSATRGDRDRRLAIAKTEREVATIERRNCLGGRKLSLLRKPL